MENTVTTPSKQEKQIDHLRRKLAHVAVLAFPFGTHAAPLFNIVRYLAKLSPDSLFSFFTTAPVNKFILSQNGVVSNIKLRNLPDGNPDGYMPEANEENIGRFMRAATENFRGGVKGAEDETGRKTSCLISDAFCSFTADLAAEMGIPWVAFWVSGSYALSAHLHTELIRETITVEDNAEKQKESLRFIPGLSKLLVEDLPEGIIFGDLNSPFSRMLHQMANILPRADAVIHNSFEEISLDVKNDLNTKLKLLLHCGPVNLLPAMPPPPDAYDCMGWLDRHAPSSVTYIGFGSVCMPSPDEVAAIAHAVETTEVPFLWSIKDSGKAHFPLGFIENNSSKGKIVPWAPQSQVLAHSATGVHVSHCGWSSLMESITAGVPLICRGFFADHGINSRLTEDVFKIGVQIEGGVFTMDGLSKSLDLILRKDEGKVMRENVRRLKEAANEAMGHNGTSIKNLETLLDVVTRQI